ncbi:MAG: NAD(P)/FAD-dependent oxidoreductase [Rhodospirillales bacterium]|nr:NAD(P)/FAD-dependent oxidoreductase [Rhodospirillales bacterium]
MKRVVVVGGGAAGLGAAYTLKKRGLTPILLEAENHVGGRLAADEVDGFLIDTGVDFFCYSYDAVFRICGELDVPLVHSRQNLGWYRDGRWLVTSADPTMSGLVRNLRAAPGLGLLSRGSLKLIRNIFRQADYLTFASDSRMADIDGDESFGEYCSRIGVSESLQVTLKGFVANGVLSDVDASSQAYVRGYLANTMLRPHRLMQPEKGAGALARALRDSCADVTRVSTPVREIVVRERRATSVETDGGTIEADAVICAVPAPRALDIIPDLPDRVRDTLRTVTYSSACRLVMGLDHPPLPPGWHGAIYPEDETPLMLDRSINLPGCVPSGKSTLDLIAGRERAKELLELDDDEIKREMLRDARRNPPPGSALPGDDEGLFSRVYRWKIAVCEGPPGMFEAVANARRELGADIPNLFLAGDYTRVPLVNGALASGISAAEEAVAQLTSQPHSTRDPGIAGRRHQPVESGLHT